jgi:cyclic pyranopterin phosphate synthase
MKKMLSHVDQRKKPTMVDVSDKKSTARLARAQAVVKLGKTVLQHLKGKELVTQKGPVFQTAIIAGVMAAKKTHEWIPFCHALALEHCNITIAVKGGRVIIDTEARVTAKTGVEMEALVAASAAAVTIYDMCKALSHKIEIENIRLLEKQGGKNRYLAKSRSKF